MTLLLWIITALFFVAWIYAEVRRRICKGGWANAFEWKNRIEEERDEDRDRLGVAESQRDGFEDGLAVMSEAYADLTIKHGKQFVRVAEAVNEERAAHLRSQRENELAATIVIESIKNFGLDTLAVGDAIKFLDEFLAEHLPGETTVVSCTATDGAAIVVAAGSDGVMRCECTCADKCVFGRTGMAKRCTEEELNAGGFRTRQQTDETAEPEGLPTGLCDLPDDEFFEDGLETDTEK